MPHTIPPTFVETAAVHPVGSEYLTYHHASTATTDGVDTTVDHHTAYPTGEAVVPATYNDASPAHTPSDERSRSKSRDPFWKRTSRSQSREPEYKNSQQTSATFGQIHAAQASTEAGEHGSKSRSVSHIRQMVKAIAHDPFFHRASAHQTEEERAAELHQVILGEIQAAKASTAAGQVVREKRHASRSRSRVREAVHGLLQKPDHETKGTEASN
ncbi:BZ3500_MvSof-1268-A1-R1_Chr8-2g10135 [Microbotryum saponariae]|uniref:BZ3500_MvSof-1268-A1-R1_Chr8-2g10135 protein n=1 Tax=Microbotryum saponariae TaxID=289078 RepID=A0A2X0LRK0_9BASI|nr:BZ3500_MvSof-1268-A1-R1_Chr8-2g10135 [Microbotryum saponariae]SDA01853.1 BZ3501_MvSof-1269-A2-R1_Chr8-2g09886 [Microbotryum saponariae]